MDKTTGKNGVTRLADFVCGAKDNDSDFLKILFLLNLAQQFTTTDLVDII